MSEFEKQMINSSITIKQLERENFELESKIASQQKEIESYADIILELSTKIENAFIELNNYDSDKPYQGSLIANLREILGEVK